MSKFCDKIEHFSAAYPESPVICSATESFKGALSESGVKIGVSASARNESEITACNLEVDSSKE